MIYGDSVGFSGLYVIFFLELIQVWDRTLCSLVCVLVGVGYWKSSFYADSPRVRLYMHAVLKKWKSILSTVLVLQWLFKNKNNLEFEIYIFSVLSEIGCYYVWLWINRYARIFPSKFWPQHFLSRSIFANYDNCLPSFQAIFEGKLFSNVSAHVYKSICCGEVWARFCSTTALSHV